MNCAGSAALSGVPRSWTLEVVQQLTVLGFDEHRAA